MQLALYGRSKKLHNIIDQCNLSTFNLKKTQESDFNNTAHFKFLLPSHLLTIHLRKEVSWLRPSDERYMHPPYIMV